MKNPRLMRSSLLGLSLLSLSVAQAHASKPALDEATTQLLSAQRLWSHGADTEAVKLWQHLALLDNAYAWYNLGQAYRLGRGLPINLDAAIGAYRIAARFGYPKADEQLGLVLYGIPKRRDEALTILQNCAERGSVRANYIVGLAEMTGDGLPKDDKQAFAHLKIAAQGGIDEAWAPLTILHAQMIEAGNEILPPPAPVAPAPVADTSETQTPLASPEPSTPAPASSTLPTAGDEEHKVTAPQQTPEISPPVPAAPAPARPSALTAEVTIKTDHPMTFDQITMLLAQNSGFTVNYSINPSDEYKRSDATHRVSVNWHGPVKEFAAQIAKVFKLDAVVDEGGITFTSPSVMSH